MVLTRDTFLRYFVIHISRVHKLSDTRFVIGGFTRGLVLFAKSRHGVLFWFGTEKEINFLRIKEREGNLNFH